MAATRWIEAESKFRANQSDTTATAVSLSAWNGTPGGAMGTDIGACVDLKDGRWLWLFGDTWMPTAAGQNMSGAASSGNCSNVVALQTGSSSIPDSTLTWHARGTTGAPTAFFPKPTLPSTVNPPTFAYTRYPFGGVAIDDKVLVVGRHSEGKTSEPNNFTTTMNGPWACLLSNIAGNDPTAWTATYLTWPMSNESFHSTIQYGPVAQPVDQGGHIYFPMQGPSRSDEWTLARAPRGDVYAGDLSGLEWWAGGYLWTPDSHPDSPAGGAHQRRNILGTVDVQGSDQPGGIHRRRDGLWQFTSVPHDWKEGPGASHSAGWATSRGPGFTFDNHTTEYAIPTEVTNQFVYGAHVCPGITWEGMSPGDQCWVYSLNVGFGDPSALTKATAYVLKFLKVPGVDP
jgi:hypothetical protein